MKKLLVFCFCCRIGKIKYYGIIYLNLIKEWRQHKLHFCYCPYCGSRLIGKEIGDEGIIPYCENCNIPLWDMFTTSIITAVVNEYNETGGKMQLLPPVIFS